MERYYYHGFDHLCYYDGICHMISILRSGGLKTRNAVRDFKDQKYEHICLYRKNEDADYDDRKTYMKSVRSGWIDGCMVFVISNEIDAYKVRFDSAVGFDENGEPFTNLIDEYRYDGNISTDKIVSVAIPLDDIKMISDSGDEEYKSKVERALEMLKAVTEELKITIINSNEKDFTDKKDEELNKQKQDIL